MHRDRMGSLRTGLEAGFTLIELVVVVAILVVLAGITIPIVSTHVDDSRKARAQTDLKALANAFTHFRSDTGVWPTNNNLPITATRKEDLALLPSLYANEFTQKTWNGPYLNSGARVAGKMRLVSGTGSTAQGFLDPWGQPYRCHYIRGTGPVSAGSIVFLCKGPDRVVNTTDAGVGDGLAAGDDLVLVVSRRL